MRVYIAGPYTKGDVVLNVRNAVHAADAVLEFGHVPFVPHLTMLWHAISPKDYAEWVRLDLAWLAACDCLIRLDGESKGADVEEAEANRLGLPVYRGVKDFLAAVVGTADDA
jgi:hypothetical protein